MSTTDSIEAGGAGPSQPARPLVLGSGSPRRAALLREAGFDFIQQPPAFDERACELAHLPVETQVQRLAEGKADALAAASHQADAVLLTADTLLSLEGRPVGKPADADDARRMLTALTTQPHQAVTAVCLLPAADPQQRRTLVDVTQVRIDPPAEAELERYIASGEWRGKAGGYNLAELQDHWRFHIDGDPATVIGLPMRRLLPLLHRMLASDGTA